MKLYLSSYQLGDNPHELAQLFGENRKVGLILNALDFSADVERLEYGKKEQIDNLRNIGLKPVVIDLKDYFGKKDELKEKMSEFAGVWVTGGNTFVLAIAYKKSGFDEIIKYDLIPRKGFVYSGFSAGCCVLQKKLKGIDFVDNPEQVEDAYGSNGERVWEGVGLLDYALVPHFDSDHPESEDTNAEIEYYKKNNIRYKTLRDGEVIIDNILSL